MRGRLLKGLRWTGLGLLGLVAVFALAGWIGSSIPRNSAWVEPVAGEERSIEIMIGNNGIHTEIAMPIVTPEMDWRATFPANDITASSRPYTHVAVSWGERAFFLETPTWYDLSLTTVLNAMTGGEGVLHVAHYVRPAPSDDYRVLRLRPDEYRALVEAISASLTDPEMREVLPGYGAYDVFYSARGTYHIGNTCNQWTSDTLAAAGVTIGAWSPFAGGVMKWVPDLPEG
ncbi:TIGR02117 family protein [uncultured Erythrobacter sp.]|uniref:TIGR02117 family protein n=1 Tax=uncultured Erythrobacter sp. TaxID=263913 RepID=UPI0026175DBF|nr:TIGR02117 family protein [uncultured Erythrobacter sp.]